MPSIFTRIIRGELPSFKVLEDERTIAILALDQVTLGHTLVIPKLEVSHWYEVPEEDFLQVQKNSLKLAKAIKAATGAPRILTATVGFEVPHYHLHLIPGASLADLDFTKGKRRSQEEMNQILREICKHLQ